MEQRLTLIAEHNKEVYDTARGNKAENARLDVAAKGFSHSSIGPLLIDGLLTRIAYQTATKLSKKYTTSTRWKKGLLRIKGDTRGAGEFYTISIFDKWRNGAWVSKIFQKIVNDDS